VVDVYSRAIVGWSAATNKRTPLVLGALDMALWRRDRAGQVVGPGLVHHSAGSQYTSFRFTTHLIEADIDASIGTVGDALDNALMESTIGLYKTELIKPGGPWRGLADVELATAEWVDWYIAKWLHSAIGHVPPDEYESMYYAQHRPREMVGVSARPSRAWTEPRPASSRRGTDAIAAGARHGARRPELAKVPTPPRCSFEARRR
jgi:putative transposase